MIYNPVSQRNESTRKRHWIPVVLALSLILIVTTLFVPKNQAHKEAVPFSNRRLQACSPGNESCVAIVIQTDDYGMDNSWTLDQISTGETIANGGDYESNQEYTVDVPLHENDDYLFTMRDKNGNGMCCQEGEGSYLILSSDGQEIVRGDRFRDKVKVLYCVLLLPHFLDHLPHTRIFTYQVFHIIRIGYDPELEMDAVDVEWLDAHNTRRNSFHTIENDETFVPLKWSQSLKNDAADYIDHLLGDCNVDEIHPESGVEEGANLFGESGFSRKNALDDPEEVLRHWFDQKEGKGFHPSFSQIAWRGTQYVGCASGRTADGCERHVCRYVPPGNCRVDAYDDWLTSTLLDSTICGARCPDDGCYVV